MFKKLMTGIASIAVLAQLQATEFSNLTLEDFKLGKAKYLVYMQDDTTGDIRFSSIWQRTTTIAKKDNETVIEITQKWSSAEKKLNREIKSINRVADFAPIYHWSKNSKGVEAYQYNENSILGDKALDSNLKKDFSLATDETPLNWELDIETFQLLDYAPDKVFTLNFYHPGSKSAPAEYAYKVTGSETLQLAGLPPIDCWTLKIDYDKDSYATFWIDKQSKQMLKMEEKWKHFTRFKYLLPA